MRDNSLDGYFFFPGDVLLKKVYHILHIKGKMKAEKFGDDVFHLTEMSYAPPVLLGFFVTKLKCVKIFFSCCRA